MGKLIAPISSAKRKHALQEAINESLYTSAKKNSTILSESADEYILTESAQTDMIAKGLSLSKRKRDGIKKSRMVENTIFNENLDMLEANAFAMVVYESLPIDDEDKVERMESIYEYAVDAFEGSRNIGALNVNRSPLFYLISNDLAKNIEDNYETLDSSGIEEILANVYSTNMQLIKPLADMVTDKTVHAVRTEQKIVNSKNSIDSETSGVIKESFKLRQAYHNTLFRSINERVINEELLVNESVSLEDKEVMNESLFKTILEYATFETLHSSKLIDVDYSALIEESKFF